VIPRLLLIADGFASGRAGQSPEEVQQFVIAAVKAGVPWIQLRDHAADTALFASAAESLVRDLRAVAGEVLISVNTHIGVAAALNSALHVGWRGPSPVVAQAQRGEAVISVAVHDEAEARHAATQGAGVLIFSPVFRTRTKPDHHGAGLPALSAVCAAVSVPVIALGGISPGRVRACLDAGAHGVAVLSGILDARPSDIEAIVQAYLAELQ